MPALPVPSLRLGLHRAGDVPVTPDADQARRWAQEELARGIYSQRPGLLERVLDWVIEQINALNGLSVDGGWLVPLLLVLATAALVTIAFVVGVPTRRRRARESAAVLDGDLRSADALRAAADAARARGDHATAVLERFRGVVRDLAERGILDEVPGLTAHEAAATAGHRLQRLREDLASAGTLFDGARYGHRAVTARDDSWLEDLDRRVSAERPAQHGAAPARDAESDVSGARR